MKTAIAKLNYYFHIVSGFLVLVLMFLTLAEIVMRRFFNSPIQGTFELTMLLLSLIVFFGCGFAQENQAHVVIDFIYERLPRFVQRILSIISTLIYSVTVVLMVWTVFQFAQRQMAAGATTPILRMQLYPFVFLSAIGLAALTLAVLKTLFFVTVEKGVLGHDAG